MIGPGSRKAPSASRSGDERRRELAAFLPALLEIQESPPHPLARRLFWIVTALLLLALTWAVFGRVSIVAVANGRIVPDAGVKIVQPIEKAVVIGIHVREGDRVAQGQLLLELDATDSSASRKRLQSELSTLRASVAVDQALLEAIRLNRLDPQTELQLPEEGNAPWYRSLLRQRWLRYRTRRRALQQAREQSQAEMAATRARISKLEQTLPIVEQRMKNLESLQNRKFVSRNEYLQAQQEHIQQQQDLRALKHSLQAQQAAERQGEENIRLHRAHTRAKILAELNEQKSRISSVTEELDRYKALEARQKLHAPVSGRVQDLVVTTLGGVVTPAQPLMRIVPAQRRLEVEAYLPNKDIGFVHEGMKAEVKIRAFPYTRYGVIDAVLKRVSNDAIQDKEKGLLYRLLLQLDTDRLHAGGREYLLQPGMEVTVELHTGERRIIDFFLSPIKQAGQEALRER